MVQDRIIKDERNSLSVNIFSNATKNLWPALAAIPNYSCQWAGLLAHDQ